MNRLFTLNRAAGMAIGQPPSDQRLLLGVHHNNISLSPIPTSSYGPLKPPFYDRDTARLDITDLITAAFAPRTTDRSRRAICPIDTLGFTRRVTTPHLSDMALLVSLGFTLRIRRHSRSTNYYFRHRALGINGSFHVPDNSEDRTRRGRVTLRFSLPRIIWGEEARPVVISESQVGRLIEAMTNGLFPASSSTAREPWTMTRLDVFADCYADVAGLWKLYRRTFHPHFRRRSWPFADPYLRWGKRGCALRFYAKGRQRRMLFDIADDAPDGQETTRVELAVRSPGRRPWFMDAMPEAHGLDPHAVWVRLGARQGLKLIALDFDALFRLLRDEVALLEPTGKELDRITKARRTRLAKLEQIIANPQRAAALFPCMVNRKRNQRDAFVIMWQRSGLSLISAVDGGIAIALSRSEQPVLTTSSGLDGDAHREVGDRKVLRQSTRPVVAGSDISGRIGEQGCLGKRNRLVVRQTIHGSEGCDVLQGQRNPCTSGFAQRFVADRGHSGITQGVIYLRDLARSPPTEEEGREPPAEGILVGRKLAG